MRVRLAMLTATAAVAITPTADAHLGGIERKARLRCDQQHVRACILRAAIHRGQDPAYMRAVAYCESRYNPYAVNASSGASGLWQYLASTWAGTPYAHRSRFSAKWSSLAAARMFAAGRSSEWVCS